MGNTNLKASDLDPDNFQAVSKANFVYHLCIGKGGFGKVWRVERKKARQYFAMKEMSKARIITKRSVKSVINERQILAQLKNPFIVNMHYAFQDRENLYLVMDYLSGGDLRYHICKNKRFNEETTRFFVACLVSGLEYFHKKNIIHRDIKPENLVIDQDGYLRITDFGIARVWREENAQDTSGTPGYMAPEVMCRQNHTTSVDFFAVGVMAYECMLGRRPYIGRSRQEIRDHILSKQKQIRRPDIPRGWTIESVDFINRMIQRKPAHRLGSNGAEEVKNHPWLRDFPWDDLAKKKLRAPFVPPNEENFDQKNINEEWRDLKDEQFKQNLLSLRDNSTQELFQGYYYDHEIASFTEREVVQRSGLNEVIMQTIQQLEQRSQTQEPQQMLRSMSSATVSGIYSQQQLPKNQETSSNHQSSVQSFTNNGQYQQNNSAGVSQNIISKHEQISNRRHHAQQHSFTAQNSQQQLTNLQQQQQQSATSTYHGIPLQSIQNNYMNDGLVNGSYIVQKQATSTTQRPMSNTAASTLNAGVVTSQHSHSNSYSQQNSAKPSMKHSRHGSAKAASTMNNSSHNVGGTGSQLQLQQHILQQTSQQHGGAHHVKHNSASLAHHQANTLSQSYLHQNVQIMPVPQVSGSVLNSAHKRNIHQLTQPTNFKQHSNSNSMSHGPNSHYQNGSQTIKVNSSGGRSSLNEPNQLSMSHQYNQGLGFSVKQNQLRHSQHFQQQMLQSQHVPSSSPGMIHIQHHQIGKPTGNAAGQKSAMAHPNIKIQQQSQGSGKNSTYVLQQKFAKSECPTPKSHEIEHRMLSSQQQKFFSRKSSGINQAQVQNIQMTGLHHQGSVIGSNHHHIQAQMHLNQPIQQQNASNNISRQVVQSQGHSRRQSGRSNDFSASGSVQHVSSKVKGIIPETASQYDQRNGYSNRQKIIGSSYHASSLSFSKNSKMTAKQASATIHQTYNGTGPHTGLHSHNSSIHSSHMKTRSPGNSQLSTIHNQSSVGGGHIQNHHHHGPSNHVASGGGQVVMNPGGTASIQMHQFHPSGTLHQKNSMSLGQYETTKVKIRRNNLVGPGTEKRKRTTKFK